MNSSGLLENRHYIHDFKPELPEITMNDYTILATRYDKRTNTHVRRSLEILSIGSERMGFAMLYVYNLCRKLYGKFRMLIKSPMQGGN